MTTKSRKTLTDILRASLIPILYLVLLSGSVGLWLHARPADFDAAGKYRAGRFQEIARRYKHRSPEKKLDLYILARTYDELADSAVSPRKPLPRTLLRAFRAYLAVAGIRCDVRGKGAVMEAHLVKCLRAKKPIYRHHLERAAFLHASELAANNGLRTLRRLLPTLANFADNDPVNRRLYMKMIGLRLRSGQPTKAGELARSNPRLEGSSLTFERGRALLRSGRAGDARKAWFKAGLTARFRYQRKQAFREIRRAWPNLFAPGNLSRKSDFNRNILVFAEFLNRRETDALKKSISPAELIRTTSPERVRGDGLFLIRSRQASRLEALARAQFEHLSRNDGIVFSWHSNLMWNKEYGAYARSVKQFAALKKEHRGIWRWYLSYLNKRGNRGAYFRETLAFLKVFPADIRATDHLIEFLIGKNHKRIAWAAPTYWARAEKELPVHDGSGRFTYWLKQYYRVRGDKKRARSIDVEYYQRAPGTYYAHTFWQKRKDAKSDYTRDWRRVRDRKSYLRWVAVHGGNDRAVRFLARRNFNAYLDPAAVNLWRRIQQQNYDMPQPIMDFYAAGEYAIAGAYYNQRYGNTLNRVENLSRKAYIGRRTGNLFLSVYYVRQLARALLVSEDPFSMPPGLLRELYPRPYLGHVRQYSRKYGISENMVYALMRQESMYRERATSRSGAKGLMQIMPRTGAWLARRMGIREYDLYNPRTSIKLGTKFFADLMRMYDRDFRMASLAYNGGPGNLRKWKRRYYEGDLNRFLEFLPVHETRNYCRITYKNYQHYRVTYLLR